MNGDRSTSSRWNVGPAALGAGVAVCVPFGVAWIAFRGPNDLSNVFGYWRAVHLFSGVSPVPPVLALCSLVLLAAWTVLRMASLAGESAEHPLLAPPPRVRGRAASSPWWSDGVFGLDPSWAKVALAVRVRRWAVACLMIGISLPLVLTVRSNLDRARHGTSSLTEHCSSSSPSRPIPCSRTAPSSCWGGS